MPWDTMLTSVSFKTTPVMREHQTNPNGGVFYKIAGLSLLFKIVSIMKDKEAEELL